MGQDTYKISPVGLNIERLRRMLNMSQETLANKVGMTRQIYSRLIHSQNMGEDQLKQFAEALGVKPEIIKSFSEESVFNYIQNNYEGANAAGSYIFGTGATLNNNPVDKLMEMLEENRQLLEENRKLYGMLLNSEKEKYSNLQAYLTKLGIDTSKP